MKGQLGKKRRTDAAARLQEPGIDQMRDVFTRINASPFLRGESERGWRATFDWALKPANIVKVLEGAYESHSSRSNGGAPCASSMSAAREMAESEARRASVREH